MTIISHQFNCQLEQGTDKEERRVHQPLTDIFNSLGTTLCRGDHLTSGCRHVFRCLGQLTKIIAVTLSLHFGWNDKLSRAGCDLLRTYNEFLKLPFALHNLICCIPGQTHTDLKHLITTNKLFWNFNSTSATLLQLIRLNCTTFKENVWSCRRRNWWLRW